MVVDLGQVEIAIFYSEFLREKWHYVEIKILKERFLMP